MMVLTACSGEEKHPYDYTFIGEGAYWESEYFVTGTEIWGKEDGSTTYSNEHRDEFVLTYKGALKELSSLEYIEYSYETSAGGGRGTRKFNEPPTEVTFGIESSQGIGAKVREDEVIHVKVKWDSYEESFELHKASE